MLSKFYEKSAQKWLIFSSKANYARDLFKKYALEVIIQQDNIQGQLHAIKR